MSKKNKPHADEPPTKRQSDLLRLIGKDPSAGATYEELSKALGVGKHSTAALVKGLRDRGLVTSVRVGRQFEVRPVGPARETPIAPTPVRMNIRSLAVRVTYNDDRVPMRLRLDVEAAPSALEAVRRAAMRWASDGIAP